MSLSIGFLWDFGYRSFRISESCPSDCKPLVYNPQWNSLRWGSKDFVNKANLKSNGSDSLSFGVCYYGTCLAFKERECFQTHSLGLTLSRDSTVPGTKKYEKNTLRTGFGAPSSTVKSVILSPSLRLCFPRKRTSSNKFRWCTPKKNIR